MVEDKTKPDISESTNLSSHKLSISESARWAGVSRTTFYKHIKSKPIPVKTDDDDKKFIYASDLVIAYNGKLKGRPDDIEKTPSEQGEQPEVSNKLETKHGFTPMNSQVEQVLRERIGDLENQIEDLKKDKEGLTLEKDKVWQQVEHYQRLLPEPKAAPAVGKTRKKKESSKPKKKGFWAQAFGR